MSSCCGMFCYFCNVRITDPKHIAIDDEGEIVSLCTPCYELAAKFFKRGGNKNAESGRDNEGYKQEV